MNLKRLRMRSLVLRISLSSSLRLEMIRCSPVAPRMRVDLRPICSTAPSLRAELDVVADAEGPVEDDRERREQVGEDALRGEADGDAADAEAGDEAGDVDAEIAEHHHQRDREQHDRDEQADDAERAGERRCRHRRPCVRCSTSAEDDLAHPDRRLEHRGDGEEELDRRRRPSAARWHISTTSRIATMMMKKLPVLRDRAAEDRIPVRHAFAAPAQPQRPSRAPHGARRRSRWRWRPRSGC